MAPVQAQEESRSQKESLKLRWKLRWKKLRKNITFPTGEGFPDRAPYLDQCYTKLSFARKFLMESSFLSDLRACGEAKLDVFPMLRLPMQSLSPR